MMDNKTMSENRGPKQAWVTPMLSDLSTRDTTSGIPVTTETLATIGSVTYQKQSPLGS